MRNKFDYKSREAQTTYPEVRERGASTCPPSTDVMKGEVTQWDIFDTYIEEFKREAKEDEKPGHDNKHAHHDKGK